MELSLLVNSLNAQLTPEQIKRLYADSIGRLNHGDWPGAALIAKRLMSQVHDHAGLQFIAGVAAMGMRQLGPAIAHLREAVRLNPQRQDYLAQLARAYAGAGDLRAAHESAAHALQLEAQDALSLDTVGVVLTQANAHALAAKAFEAAVERAPGRANYHYNLATSLMFSGAVERAEREYEACIGLEPRFWKAHLARAQLRRQTMDNNHLSLLRELLGQHEADPAAAVYLNLAISRELEDLGDYTVSFEHLIAGKAVLAARHGYESSRDEELFDAIASTFENLPPHAPGFESAEPIFVVGMPRSGTTLVERILCSHAHVHSAGELNNFPLQTKRVSGSTTRSMLDKDVLARTSGMDWHALGNAYVASTRPGTGHTPRFVDKLPHNFQYVGHILHALPNARIVCLRRDPMDTCIGNFRQLFALESPFYDYSFDILDVGRYFILFDRLMKRWAEMFPGRVLELHYEQLVADQKGVTRELLAHCGLPWDDACLNFHQNKEPSATASAVQVRAPLHAGFQGRWRKYGVSLDPLRELLSQAGL